MESTNALDGFAFCINTKANKARIFEMSSWQDI